MKTRTGESGVPNLETDAQSALVRVFGRCRKSLAQIARAFVKPHDIEDIVQETFLRTYEASIHAEIRHPRSFMETTARNLAVNFAVRLDNAPKQDIDALFDASLPHDAPPLEDCIDSQERLRLFCGAVRRLPVQCRRAFLLKKVYGLRRHEIAEYLGINESTVQKHIAKGMAMVTEYMEAMTSSAGRPARHSRIPRRRSHR